MENYQLGLKEYEERSIKVSAAPSMFYLETVKGCTYKCIMCQPSGEKPKKISPQLLTEIDPYLKDLEILAIHGDGEPLFADLDYFVEKSIEHNFVMHMVSTGFFLSKEMCDKFKKTRVSIWFSIHSGSPITYYKIMGAKFERVIKNIKYLTTSITTNPHQHDFGFSFMVIKENVNEIEDFLYLAYDCGIKKVRFMPLHPTIENVKGVTARNFHFKYNEQYNDSIIEEFTRKLPTIVKLATQLDITVDATQIYLSHKRMNIVFRAVNKIARSLGNENILPIRPIRAKNICPALWLGQLMISQNGDVTLCCRSSKVIGNINHTSLHEIWHSPFIEGLRRVFHRGYIPKHCGSCHGYRLEHLPRNSFNLSSETIKEKVVALY